MSVSALLLFTPLIGLLCWAAATDLRTRRIPNVLSVALVASGLLQSFLPYHTVLPAQAALGLAVGFSLGVVLWIMGALGGADVKLLAGVGAWIGCPRLLQVYLAQALVGLLIVLIQALWQGRLRVLMRNSLVVTLNLFHLGETGVTSLDDTRPPQGAVDKPLPYAVPILAATLLVLGSPNFRLL